MLLHLMRFLAATNTGAIIGTVPSIVFNTEVKMQMNYLSVLFQLSVQLIQMQLVNTKDL
jgi:hypothetical protein